MAVSSALDELRTLLHSSRPRDNLDAMEAAARMHADAGPLVPDLVRFLYSEAYVPCTARKYEFSGHAILAEEAMRVIEEIGVAPPMDELRRLLADRRVTMMPEASYDQGAYIGDYSSSTFSPAGLAARLVPLYGQDSFALLSDLLSAALDEPEEIRRPAQRAMKRLALVAMQAAPEHHAAYAAAIEHIAGLPEVVTPATHRGFDLCDLVRDCRKVLGQGAEDPPKPAFLL